ncbi:MAG TPA: hypothetical protein VFC23_10180 [Thermoanaerobaculia bacterium]|nr:hypothetical protein [Thermoanaerobaculia bacterium]
MDQELLVDYLSAVYRKLDQQYGPIPLLMLLALVPGVEDYWNLVVSAAGLDQDTRVTAIHKVVDLLPKEMPKAIRSSIGRVSVLRTDDPFVQGINKIKRRNQMFAEEDPAIHLQDTKVSGIEIPEAIVLLQRPKAA